MKYKKSLMETYLKGIDNYLIKLHIDKSKVIILKRINDIQERFYIVENGKNVCILDEGYHILEYMPLNANYICRIHLDKEMNVIEYFFNISLENKIENGIPVYDDVRLAVVLCDGNSKLHNEDKIEEMLNNGIINQEQYEKSYAKANSIMNEIESKTNDIINSNILEYFKEVM